MGDATYRRVAVPGRTRRERFVQRVLGGPYAARGYAALLAAWSGLYVATHKLTRILTKDWVTAPPRAPFVRYEGSAGGGEVREKVRGTGLRKAVGDLLTCPWCTGPWVAGALVAALVTRPQSTRVVAAGFSAVALSDFLHHTYQAAKDRGR